MNRVRAIYTLSAKRATRLSTVSEYSKKDMVRFYGVSPERIHVVPDGVDTRRFRPCADTGRVAKWRIEAFVSDVAFILNVEKTH